MTTDAVDLPPSEDAVRLDARCDQWIAAMAGGDEQALGSLYDATVSRLFAVAVRILEDSSLAEDVVTEAYYDAWSNAASFDRERGRPITWLLTLCRNRALDMHRKRASAQKRVDAAAMMTTTPVVRGPEDLLAVTQDGHVVHAVLATIATEDRQLIALAFFRGLSHQQIADSVNMPLGTVKSRIRRALKALESVMPQGHQHN